MPVQTYISREYLTGYTSPDKLPYQLNWGTRSQVERQHDLFSVTLTFLINPQNPRPISLATPVVSTTFHCQSHLETLKSISSACYSPGLFAWELHQRSALIDAGYRDRDHPVTDECGTLISATQHFVRMISQYGTRLYPDLSKSLQTICASHTSSIEPAYETPIPVNLEGQQPMDQKDSYTFNIPPHRTDGSILFFKQDAYDQPIPEHWFPYDPSGYPWNVTAQISGVLTADMLGIVRKEPGCAHLDWRPGFVISFNRVGDQAPTEGSTQAMIVDKCCSAFKTVVEAGKLEPAYFWKRSNSKAVARRPVLDLESMMDQLARTHSTVATILQNVIYPPTADDLDFEMTGC